MDAGLAAMVLEEAGGTPVAAEDDAGEAEGQRSEVRGQRSKDQRQRTKTKGRQTSAGASEDDESQHDEDSPETDADQENKNGTDQDAEGADDAEGAEDQPEGAEETDEKAEADGTDESDGTDGADDAEVATAEDDANPDETPAWAKKRFREYSQKLKEKDRQIDTLLRKLDGGTAEERTAPTRQTGSVESQLLEVETPEDLDTIRERYERLEDWAIANRDGIEADPDKPTVQAYTREQVAQVLTTARQAQRQIPRREAALARVRDYNARAIELFPDFDDPDSELSQARDYILQQVPELKRLPNYMIIVGDAVAHEGVRRKKAQAARADTRGRDGRSMPGKPAAAAVRRVPPAVPGAPARAPSQQGAGAGKLTKARQRAFSSGSEADIANLVEASLSR